MEIIKNNKTIHNFVVAMALISSATCSCLFLASCGDFSQNNVKSVVVKNSEDREYWLKKEGYMKYNDNLLIVNLIQGKKAVLEVEFQESNISPLDINIQMTNGKVKNISERDKSNTITLEYWPDEIKGIELKKYRNTTLSLHYNDSIIDLAIPMYVHYKLADKDYDRTTALNRPDIQRLDKVEFDSLNRFISHLEKRQNVILTPIKKVGGEVKLGKNGLVKNPLRYLFLVPEAHVFEQHREIFKLISPIFDEQKKNKGKVCVFRETLSSSLEISRVKEESWADESASYAEWLKLKYPDTALVFGIEDSQETTRQQKAYDKAHKLILKRMNEILFNYNPADLASIHPGLPRLKKKSIEYHQKGKQESENPFGKKLFQILWENSKEIKMLKENLYDSPECEIKNIVRQRSVTMYSNVNNDFQNVGIGFIIAGIAHVNTEGNKVSKTNISFTKEVTEYLLTEERTQYYYLMAGSTRDYWNKYVSNKDFHPEINQDFVETRLKKLPVPTPHIHAYTTRAEDAKNISLPTDAQVTYRDAFQEFIKEVALNVHEVKDQKRNINLHGYACEVGQISGMSGAAIYELTFSDKLRYILKMDDVSQKNDFVFESEFIKPLLTKSNIGVADDIVPIVDLNEHGKIYKLETYLGDRHLLGEITDSNGSLNEDFVQKSVSAFQKVADVLSTAHMNGSIALPQRFVFKEELWNQLDIKMQFSENMNHLIFRKASTDKLIDELYEGKLRPVLEKLYNYQIEFEDLSANSDRHPENQRILEDGSIGEIDLTEVSWGTQSRDQSVWLMKIAENYIIQVNYTSKKEMDNVEYLLQRIVGPQYSPEQLQNIISWVMNYSFSNSRSAQKKDGDIFNFLSNFRKNNPKLKADLFIKEARKGANGRLFDEYMIMKERKNRILFMLLAIGKKKFPDEKGFIWEILSPEDFKKYMDMNLFVHINYLTVYGDSLA